MNFQFAAPLILLLLFLVPVLFLLRRRLTLKQAGLRFSSVAITARLPRTARLRTAWLPDLLRALALVVIILALARPQLGREGSRNTAEGIDIVLALDVSYSMSEQDMRGRTRLDVAKQIADEFVAGRQNDRVGLVVFAGDAVTRTPLTLDYAAVREYLQQLTLGGRPPAGSGDLPGGTAVGHGLSNAVNLLRDSRAKSRVVVLLTDGQSNAGEIDPIKSAQMAQLLGVKVYTIGVGGVNNFPAAQGAGGAGRRPSEYARTDVVDEETLSRMAAMAGGAYFRAMDADALRKVYEQIERLEKTEIGARTFIVTQELAPYLLAAALALVLSEVVLRATVYRRIP